MLRAAFIAAITFVTFSNVASLEAVEPPKCDDQTSQQQQVGEYYKPSAPEVSGVPNTTAPFRRSPCPGLNVLANHGYLPRNGQNIVKAELKAAIMNVFNMGNDMATTQVNPVPEVFSLDYLGQHILPERDASLLRSDKYCGHDPMEANVTLVDDLLVRADANDKINTTAVAHARKDCATLCEAINPECTFGANEKQTAFLQAALLLEALGAGDFITVDHARSFLIEEKIPGDFVKSAEPVSIATLTAKYVELVTQGS